MTPGRVLRRAGVVEPAESEGPFVSFTDLFIGILFLFLILVAALMLMHQEAIRKEQEESARMQAEIQRMTEEVRQLQAKLDAAPKPKPDRNDFRLGMIFNIYQRATDSGANWTYSRTVRVFRAPTGVCINTVWMRSNLSVAWMAPTAEEDIPTRGDIAELQSFKPCGISASGDRWDTRSETGNLKRVSNDLYSGQVVLRQTAGDVRIDMQYRVLGVFDDYFRLR